MRVCARRVRRSVSVAGNVVMLLAFFVLFPLAIVLIFNGQAFGHVGVVLVILGAISMVAQADPTLPRKVRAEVLGGSVTFMIPLLAGMWSGFATYFALTPQFFGLCSTRDPTCAAAARVVAGVCAAVALLCLWRAARALCGMGGGAGAELCRFAKSAYCVRRREST